jgi:hypothetical protein
MDESRFAAHPRQGGAEDLFGLDGGRDLGGLDPDQQRELWIVAELRGRRGGELTRARVSRVEHGDATLRDRLALVVDRDSALPVGERAESEGYQQRGGHEPESDPLAPRRLAPARDDVRGMRGGGRLAVPARRGEPLLAVPEIGAA